MTFKDYLEAITREIAEHGLTACQPFAMEEGERLYQNRTSPTGAKA